MEWYTLTVSHIERLTKDSVRVDLVPAKEYLNTFQYKAGQYLTLETSINGESVRRSYSLCSAPSDDLLSVGIKEVSGGKFSTFANRALKVGDSLQSMLPNGTFLNKDESESNTDFVFFAAGSGITPILSMIKSTLNRSENSTATLFYGNKKVRSVMFLEALEALKNQFIGRFKMFHILSRQVQDSDLFNGRIDKAKLDMWSHCFDINNTNAYFMCGPEKMVLDLKDGLSKKGVSKDSIHFELFTSDAGNEARKVRKVVEVDQEIKKQVDIIVDGKTLHFEFGSADDNILDKAMETGADLPFACKGGVCCTCKAKLEEGEVKMYVNYGLEQDEIDRGFILTCQSYPVTDKLVVNYDEV